LLLSNPDPIEVGRLKEQVAGILADNSLDSDETASKLAETISDASYRGTLAGRTDSHVTVTGLRSNGGELLEPSTQTFHIKEIIACLQRRRSDDKE
jgi:formylmethanofuran dehydrogenase subunit A